MGTNFRTAWIDKPTGGYTTFSAASMNPALSSLDKAITYLKNVIIHCDGIISYNSSTGVLAWSNTLRILFNREDGMAVENTVAVGNIALLDNEFAYVDLNETNGTVITVSKAAITTGAASNFISFNRLVLGYRNTTSDIYFSVYLPLSMGANASPTFAGLTSSGLGTFSPLQAKGPAIITSFAGTISRSGTTLTFSSAADAILAGYSATNPVLGTTVIHPTGPVTMIITAWLTSTTATVDSSGILAAQIPTSVQAPIAFDVNSSNVLKFALLADGNVYTTGIYYQVGDAGGMNAYSFIARRSGGTLNYPDIYGELNGLVLADTAGGNSQISLSGTAISIVGKAPANIDIILTPTGTGAVKPGILAIAEKTPVNAVAAQGTITMSGIAVLNETFVVGAQTFTWKTTRTVAGEVTIGASAAEAVTNIITAITADLTTVTAAPGAGTTVVVTAATKGISGNSIVFTEASTNMAVNGTGTLGATTAGVNGTIGAANELCFDASYIYHAIAANTVADANWRRVALGSVY